MPGNWYDILVNVKWSKKKDGFFKVFKSTDPTKFFDKEITESG